MQINLTGFLGGSKARAFIGELWVLLASGQASPDGIPVELVEMKKKFLQKQKVNTCVFIVSPFDRTWWIMFGNYKYKMSRIRILNNMYRSE